jgi:hypothetical protein
MKVMRRALGMVYLDAGEYVSFGLDVETGDDLVVAASAMIDAFCRRPSLGVTEYVERLRCGRGGGELQLSHAPLAAAAGAASALVSVRVRLNRRGLGEWNPLAEAAAAFGLAGTWSGVDISTVDVSADGVVCVPQSLFGLAFDEAEVTYTAGFTEVPAAVKVACAQVVRNAQAMPALNVQRQSMDSMQMAYFSGSLMDAEVQRLLAPYVSVRLG